MRRLVHKCERCGITTIHGELCIPCEIERRGQVHPGRVCRDCGKDISHRPKQTRRCIECANERAKKYNREWVRQARELDAEQQRMDAARRKGIEYVPDSAIAFCEARGSDQ